MTSEELWKRSGLTGTYEAWSFGEAPDKLADLVLQKIKTATCSAYDLYLINNEPLPQAGDHSVILNSNDEVVATITTNEDGLAGVKNLPLGTYYYQEISAPENVVMDTAKHEFEIETKNQVVRKDIVNEKGSKTSDGISCLYNVIHIAREAISVRKEELKKEKNKK